jgi:acyl carrier protein
MSVAHRHAREGAASVSEGDQVLSGVTEVLQRYNTAGLAITASTDLAADLNIDSVAAMDLIMELEDRFELDIPINLVSDLTTVADLVALVDRQLQTRGAS